MIPSSPGLAEPEEANLRENCVTSGDGQCFTDYQIGRLNLPTINTSVAIIAVSLVENSVLVAVPELAWATKKKDRVLPGGALKRAVAVEVVSCSQGDRETPSEEPDLKVWVGLLDPKLEASVIYGDIGANIEFPGEGDAQMVPFAPGLVALCNDIFAFLSAESQAPQKEEADPTGQDHVEARLLAMETMLQELVSQLPRASTAAGAAPTLMARRPKPAPAPKRGGIPGNIDPAVAQQALQAGVSAEALEEMSRILGDRGVARGPTAPRPAAVEQEGEASEEEDAVGAAVAALGSADPLQVAVLQLTRLMTQLSKDKVKKKDKSLEAMLDGAEGGGSLQEPGSRARSRAAALRALHQAVKTDPKAIYSALEQRLAEDWEEEGLMPGIAPGRVSARGWLEHRSKLQHYPAAIRNAWALCGVWDLLRAGKTEEARARVGLAVAALDQQACDRGSYLLASEVMMELPPPYSSFLSHQPPEQWELQHSRLLDPRWVELMMGKLKDLSDFQEKRIKLTTTRRTEDPAAPKVEKPGKGAKGQKGKGNGKGKEAADSTAPAGVQSG